MVRPHAGYQLDARLRLRGRAVPDGVERSLRDPSRAVGDIRRALQGLLPGLRRDPARQGHQRLFREVGAGPGGLLQERFAALEGAARAALQPDRLRRVPFRVRLRPHDPVLPRSGDAQHGDFRHPRRDASRPDPDVFRLRVHQARPGVRLGAQVVQDRELDHHQPAPRAGRRRAHPRRDQRRDHDQLRLRAGLHQPAIHRPLGRCGEGRRPYLRHHAAEHPDRRGAPRADRHAAHHHHDRERAQGRGPAADRYRILAYLEAVLRAQRHLHGLLHAAGVPRAFAQGVHARVGGRSVRPQYQGPGPRPAVVLGLLPPRYRDLPPLPADRHLRLPRDPVVAAHRLRLAGRARLARREISGLERHLRQVLGRGDRQHPRAVVSKRRCRRSRR